MQEWPPFLLECVGEEMLIIGWLVDGHVMMEHGVRVRKVWLWRPIDFLAKARGFCLRNKNGSV